MRSSSASPPFAAIRWWSTSGRPGAGPAARRCRGSRAFRRAWASGSPSSGWTPTTPPRRRGGFWTSSRFPIPATATPIRRSPRRSTRRSAFPQRPSTTPAASRFTSSRASTEQGGPRRRHRALRAVGIAEGRIMWRMRGRGLRIWICTALAFVGAATAIGPSLAQGRRWGADRHRLLDPASGDDRPGNAEVDLERPRRRGRRAREARDHPARHAGWPLRLDALDHRGHGLGADAGGRLRVPEQRARRLRRRLHHGGGGRGGDVPGQQHRLGDADRDRPRRREPGSVAKDQERRRGVDAGARRRSRPQRQARAAPGHRGEEPDGDRGEEGGPDRPDRAEPGEPAPSARRLRGQGAEGPGPAHRRAGDLRPRHAARRTSCSRSSSTRPFRTY